MKNQQLFDFLSKQNIIVPLILDIINEENGKQDGVKYGRYSDK